MQLPGEFSPFIEKKVVFCLVVGGVTPLPPLSGPTTKKTTFFYVCLPLEIQPVSYKRYFRCNNCFLLLVYTINLSLSTDLVDPPPMGTFYMKNPLTYRKPGFRSNKSRYCVYIIFSVKTR